MIRLIIGSDPLWSAGEINELIEDWVTRIQLREHFGLSIKQRDRRGEMYDRSGGGNKRSNKLREVQIEDAVSTVGNQSWIEYDVDESDEYGDDHHNIANAYDEDDDNFQRN